MSITSAKYCRQNKSWSDYLGKVGKVIVSTSLKASPPEQKMFIPYSFVLVDFGEEKKELMGVCGESYVTGDSVKCVFRKLSISDEKGLINYGIKVKKL